MILIADSGSTKTDWCLLDSAGMGKYFTTEGYNPYFSAEQTIIDSIKNSFPGEIDQLGIREVHFYGAGCQDDKVQVMQGILHKVFGNCERISAEVDLLAAARGLLGNQAGFAAILGTGTNTCMYDGNRISSNIDSLGFILGDEGSGAAIGKKILGDYLRDKMPQPVKQAFEKRYQLLPAEIIQRIYGMPMANRFCASFTRFLKYPEVDADYAYRLVRSSFAEFFQQLVSCYPAYQTYTFNCIGSVAYHFKPILDEVLNDFGMKPGRILPSLITELAAYHSNPENIYT